MTTSDIVLRIEALSKRYCRNLRRSLWYGLCDVFRELVPVRTHASTLRQDEFWAIDQVSFDLRRGECLGLIGRNGAGKTTLLKLLNGLIKPDSGRIEIRGRVGALIALGAGFNPILTGRENIYANGAVLGRRKLEIDAALDRIVDFAEIGDFIDAPVQSYSSGMQVRLGFAIASQLANPDILLLDEVLAVGDASFQAKCINTVKALQQSGVAIILVSHNMHNLFRYCETGIFLERGKVICSGEITSVANRYLINQNPLEFPHPSNQIEQGNIPTGSPFILDPIEVFTEDGKLTEEIQPLQEITIRTPWRLLRPVSPFQVRIEIAANDHQGLFFQDVSDPISFPGGKVGDKGYFFTTIRGVRSNRGRLNLGITLWDTNGKSNLLGWSKDNFLSVINNRPNAGRIVMTPNWNVIKANPPLAEDTLNFPMSSNA